MSPEMLALIGWATRDTLIMALLPIVFGTVVGLPIGVFLATSRQGELLALPSLNTALGGIVNVGRSIPFIILIYALLPLTRLTVGTTIGLKGAVLPLTIAVTPFIARIVEGAIREVDSGLIEAGRSFGATPLQIIRKVLLAEALPAIVLGLTLATVSLIGFTAVMGLVGAGGLGAVADFYGRQRNMFDVLLIVIVILVLLVQLVQSAGEWIARKLDKRLRHD
ncbi:methionine ABC transporter permease [Labrys neptuniae]